MATVRHNKAKTNATGVIIRFSSLLLDLKFVRVFNPKKAVKSQTPFVTTIGLFRIENTEALSNTINEVNTKTAAESKLAIRKRVGRILYFPPQAAFPRGNPSASDIWKQAKPKNPVTAMMTTI